MRCWDICAQIFRGDPVPPCSQRRLAARSTDTEPTGLAGGRSEASYLSRSRASGEERSTRLAGRREGRLTHRVGQRFQVIGLRRRGLDREPDHVPAARRGQPVSVRRAQVVTVRLDVRCQRAENSGRVGVDVRERVDSRLLARGAGADADGAHDGNVSPRPVPAPLSSLRVAVFQAPNRITDLYLSRPSYERSGRRPATGLAPGVSRRDRAEKSSRRPHRVSRDQRTSEETNVIKAGGPAGTAVSAPQDDSGGLCSKMCDHA
jgi:hypothetical protein